MKLGKVVAIPILVALISFSAAASHAVRAQSKYVPVSKYDPKRNADQDIHDAIAEAKRTGGACFWKLAAIGVVGVIIWTTSLVLIPI